MSEPQVLLPATDRNVAGARLLPGKVLEAVSVLEIGKSVTIRWAAGIRCRGSHRYRNGRHAITLSTYQGATDTTKTLWHELWHAVQQERHEGNEEGFDRLYAVANSLLGYSENPFEIEARVLADLMADEPLADQGAPRAAGDSGHAYLRRSLSREGLAAARRRPVRSPS